MPITNLDLRSAGFAAAPNNIHSLPGQGWYACGPAIPTVGFSQEIRLIDGALSVWTTKYYKRPDSTFNFSISGIVTELSSLEDLRNYCDSFGRLSQGGIGPSNVYNVWD